MIHWSYHASFFWPEHTTETDSVEGGPNCQWLMLILRRCPSQLIRAHLPRLKRLDSTEAQVGRCPAATTTDVFLCQIGFSGVPMRRTGLCGACGGLAGTEAPLIVKKLRCLGVAKSSCVFICPQNLFGPRQIPTLPTPDAKLCCGHACAARVVRCWSCGCVRGWAVQVVWKRRRCPRSCFSGEVWWKVESD